MKKADRSGATLAFIWGEDEVAAGEVTIKPLRDGQEQVRLPLVSLAETIPSLLQQHSH
jgi:histidyl-tRNA synthetase